MSSNVIRFPNKEEVKIKATMKVPSYIRKLASSLMLKLQVQEGMELVCLIGNGDEYSNQRAIETWLMRQYTEEDIESMVSPLDILERALMLLINDNNYEQE